MTFLSMICKLLFQQKDNGTISKMLVSDNGHTCTVYFTHRPSLVVRSSHGHAFNLACELLGLPNYVPLDEGVTMKIAA